MWRSLICFSCLADIAGRRRAPSLSVRMSRNVLDRWLHFDYELASFSFRILMIVVGRKGKSAVDLLPATAEEVLPALELGGTKGCLAVPCHAPTLRPLFARCRGLYHCFGEVSSLMGFYSQHACHILDRLGPVVAHMQSRFVHLYHTSQPHRDRIALKHCLGTCPLPARP